MSIPSPFLLLSPYSPPVAKTRRFEFGTWLRANASRPSKDDRGLLEMKLVEGLDNEEIATRLGIGKGALRTRASRALKRLRRGVELAAKEARP